MLDYRPDLPTANLLYLDCNSLYSTYQTYPLPMGGFRFLTERQLLDFDLASASAGSETGYFIFHYPKHLHNAHNLRDKTRYVAHYRCLQFYLKHGMELTKIHRVVAFTQHAFMLPFIKFCNDGRKNARSDFESSPYKLVLVVITL